MSEWVAASIILSAATYLFDFCSNLAVIYEYGRPYLRFLRRKQENRCADLCHNLASEAAAYFWSLLAFLILAHTLNALIFRFKFRKEDGPYRSAYFLPLIHLWRLFSLIRRTMSYKGVEDLRSPDMSGLFSILGCSLEGMPILTLQFAGYIILTRDGILPPMPTLFKISMAASLLSTAYNGGTSVQVVAVNAKTLGSSLQVAISAGISTMFASVTRCLTYINLLIRFGDYFDENRPVRLRPRFYLSDSILMAFVVFSIHVYWIYYWLFSGPRRQWKSKRKCLISLVYAYMSAVVGPLYPMVSEARDAGQLGGLFFELKIFVITMVNTFVDMLILWVSHRLGTLPFAYALASLSTALGYVTATLWYIRTDRLCGSVSLASESSDNFDLNTLFQES